MSNSGSSSLRPAWKGGRGFQPPPAVTSDTTSRGRSSSIASSDGGKRDSNKFSALQDDDDFLPVGGKKSRDRGDRNSNPNSHHNDDPKQNSRSEALRSGFGGSGGGGGGGGRRPKGGRSLADLASTAPEGGVARSSSTGYAPAEGGPTVPRGGRRYSTSDANENEGRPQRNEPSAYKQAVDAANVIRYTREKLLAFRPRPDMDAGFPPPHLKHVEATILFAEKPQDPVCWDTFDSDAIWALVPNRRSSMPLPKGAAGVVRAEEVPGERRRSYNAPSNGRWQRGQALPPSEDGGKRKDKDASSPNDLWDDPTAGAVGAAMDFSAFGAMPDGDGASTGSGDAFDFEKMTEATRKFEEELHPKASEDADDLDDGRAVVKVDPKRPLATVGTTIRSGSGDGANVFEDFDAPGAEAAGVEGEQPIKAAGEDPSASSILMAMIGVKKEGGENLSRTASGSVGESPWNGSAPAGDTSGLLGLGGPASSTTIPLNPWGDPIISTGSAPPAQQNAGGGLGVDLASRLESFAAEQKALESAEMQQKELARRRQEQDDSQRRAMAQQQQVHERARHQQAQQQQPMQQQQPSPQSQVETVLMERITAILENTWGRSDLMSILSTLHAEDSRVIPLLGSVDLLRELIAHNPRRVALRQDPAFPAEMAVLQMTNVQWQQHEAQRAQQEELRRREEQLRMENIQRQRSMSSDGGPPRINPDAPWFYSDPQGNVQGPFRGDEMRQWLEAGYFKGDLPISQQPGGPFIALAAIFQQDLSTAFKVQPSDNRAQEEAEARARAEEERILGERRQAETLEREMERQRQAGEQTRQEQHARATAERDQQARQAAAEAEESNGANQSSAQLKMMLGLSQQQGAAQSEPAPPVEQHAQKPQKGTTKSEGKNNNNQKRSNEPAPAQETPPAPKPAKPAAPAWGGAATQATVTTRKSMSEIQKEEARRAAALAAQGGGSSRQSGSGWANVAATGSKAWTPGTVKPTAAAVAGGGPPAAASRGSMGAQPGARPKPPAAGVRKAGGAQHQGGATSHTAAEEFGASMSPALEKWCKDQMVTINGTDDLTLVSFCMTLNDASEIRQYLTTYLGSTPQVNNFATEFINRKGGGPPKQEEWATPGSAKKGRKKKGAK